jgi:hypothetical protein
MIQQTQQDYPPLLSGYLFDSKARERRKAFKLQRNPTIKLQYQAHIAKIGRQVETYQCCGYWTTQKSILLQIYVMRRVPTWTRSQKFRHPRMNNSL